MMILVLDNNRERRNKTADFLRQIYPNCSIITQGDPLAAVQYIYHNPVDFVITALHIRPMNSLQYIEAVRKVNKKAKIFILANDKELSETLVFEDDADGFLSEPLSENNVRAVLSGQAVSI